MLAVEPKAFRALLFLLRNSQKVVSKEELLKSVWGDVLGSTRCIWLLRRTLGDDINQPRYVETVATIGYRFVSPVEVLEDSAENPDKHVLGLDENGGGQATATAKRSLWVWAVVSVAVVAGSAAADFMVEDSTGASGGGIDYATHRRLPRKSQLSNQWVEDVFQRGASKR